MQVGEDTDWSRFDPLKRYIESRIGANSKQVASQMASTSMAFEMIQTLYQLVEGGFYDIEELQALRVPLLLMLDGRSDSIGREGFAEEPADR